MTADITVPSSTHFAIRLLSISKLSNEQKDIKGFVVVPSDGEKSHAQLIYLRTDPANRLRGIRVHENTSVMGDASDFGERLHRPSLVVGVHDSDEGRAFANDVPELLEEHTSAVVHCYAIDTPTVLREIPTRGHGGRVLDR